MSSRTGRTESGQAALLVIGFFLVALLVVVVVVDASVAYLRRQQLDALADGAALAAADAIRAEQVYRDGLGERAQIDATLARQHVRDHLAAVDAFGDHPDLTVRVRTSGDTVRVTVAMPLELPFTPPGWTLDATVTGRAAAYVPVGGG